jgi:hypothetical protein
MTCAAKGGAGQGMDQNEGVVERETWVTDIVSPYVYNERNEEDAILEGRQWLKAVYLITSFVRQHPFICLDRETSAFPPWIAEVTEQLTSYELALLIDLLIIPDFFCSFFEFKEDGTSISVNNNM